jgi:membrane-bound lytic murein transglycosylase B
VRIAGDPASVASAAFAKVRGRAGRVMRTPAFGIAVLVPLVLAGAVGASAPSHHTSVDDNGITSLAAVARTGDSGATVVAAVKRPAPFHFAAATASAPPSVVVNSPGSLRIPAMALNAYRNAESMMAGAYPACGISWNLLAGIGRIESMHANGGATDAHGTPIQPIYGPALDGTLAGNEVIVQSVQAGRVTYARAMGPMQFLPGTWARYASDGDGDGKADVQNLYDSTLAAARYLCSGGLNLRDQSQVMAAILRYNNSVAYAQNVLGWAAAYATGVVPVNLPPITGPAPLGDAHLDANPEGLGPGLPLNAAGLPADDPLALMTLLPDTAGRLGPGFATGPLPGPGTVVPQQNCQVFCLVPQAPAAPANELPAAPFAPPPLFPPPPFAPPPLFPPPLFPPPPPPPLPFGAPPDPAPVVPAPGPLPGPLPGPAN